MPIYKKEHRVTVYFESESESLWDMMFGLQIDEHIHPPKDNVKITFMSETCGIPQKVSPEEMERIHEEHEASMKCPGT